MLIFNFLIPYFASLSVFCERKREHSTKKSPHLDTKVRGFFCDATVPVAVLRWADGGLGESESNRGGIGSDSWLEMQVLRRRQTEWSAEVRSPE